MMRTAIMRIARVGPRWTWRNPAAGPGFEPGSGAIRIDCLHRALGGVLATGDGPRIFSPRVSLHRDRGSVDGKPALPDSSSTASDVRTVIQRGAACHGSDR